MQTDFQAQKDIALLGLVEFNLKDLTFKTSDTTEGFSRKKSLPIQEPVRSIIDRISPFVKGNAITCTSSFVRTITGLTKKTDLTTEEIALGVLDAIQKTGSKETTVGHLPPELVRSALIGFNLGNEIKETPKKEITATKNRKDAFLQKIELLSTILDNGETHELFINTKLPAPLLHTFDSDADRLVHELENPDKTILALFVAGRMEQLIAESLGLEKQEIIETLKGIRIEAGVKTDKELLALCLKSKYLLRALDSVDLGYNISRILYVYNEVFDSTDKEIFNTITGEKSSIKLAALKDLTPNFDSRKIGIKDRLGVTSDRGLRIVRIILDQNLSLVNNSL